MTNTMEKAGAELPPPRSDSCDDPSRGMALALGATLFSGLLGVATLMLPPPGQVHAPAACQHATRLR